MKAATALTLAASLAMAACGHRQDIDKSTQSFGTSKHPDPRVRPQRPDLVKSAIPPDYGLSSHAAPLGLAFYTGDSFPAPYRGGAFIGEHGSWNRPELNGYRVVFIAFKDGRPVGQPIDFVTGFVKDGKARGRPVGVAVDRAGALIVADDVGNTVWRVTSGSAGR